MKKVTIQDLGLKFEGLNDQEKAFMTNVGNTMCEVCNKMFEGAATSDEVQTKFDEVNALLKGFDAEKFAQAIKDNSDLCAQVKQLSETIEKLQQKGIGMSDINKFDELIDAMFNSEKFQDFVDGRTNKSGSFDGFSLKTVSMTSDYTGSALTTQQEGKVVSQVNNKRLHLRSVVNTLQGDPQYPNLAFTQIYDIDRNAAMVSENGTLPASSFKVKEVNASTKRLGTYLNISKRMLKSRVYVRSFILNMLPEAVKNTEDFQMLKGDGNGENLLGIINHTGVTAIETLIGTAVFATAAGDVKSITSATGGVVLEFKKAYDLLLDGMKITLAGATTNTGLNTTFDVEKLNDHEIFLRGATIGTNATSNAADAALITTTVKNSAFQSIEAPNSGDVVATAFAVMDYAQFSANAIVMNPITVNAIMSEKDTMGHNLGIITVENGVKYIAGRPIVESTNIEPGKYLVGDFMNGANLVDYTTLSVEFAEDVNSKLKNEVSIIAQEEVIFPVYNPWAFAYGSLSALKSAITLPTPTDDDDTPTTYSVSLSLTSGSESKGTVQVDSESAGATCSKSGIASGTSVTIKAIAASGNEFVKWSDNDTNATRTITVSSNVTLTAQFQAEG